MAVNTVTKAPNAPVRAKVQTGNKTAPKKEKASVDSAEISTEKSRAEANEFDKMKSLRQLSVSAGASLKDKKLSDKEVDQKVDKIVDKHAGTLYNDNEKIGKELARSNDSRVIDRTLDRAGGVLDGDNISYETSRNMSDRQIQEMAQTKDGMKTLRRMRSEMAGGNVTAEEKAQIARLEKEVGRPGNDKLSVKYKGEVPQAIAKAYSDGKLDLSQITPEMYKKLSPEERSGLMKQVSGQDVWPNYNPVQAGGIHRDEEGRVNIGQMPADKYFLDQLAKQEPKGEAATDAFTRLSPSVQEKINLTPAAAKSVGSNMTQLLNTMKERDGNTLSAQSVRTISNVVRKYPVETREELESLIGQVSKSVSETGAGMKDLERADFEGAVTGAVLAGFIRKGEPFRDLAKQLGYADTAAGVIPRGDVAVPIQLGLKALAEYNESIADNYEKVGIHVKGEMKRVWSKQANQESGDPYQSRTLANTRTVALDRSFDDNGLK